MDFSPKTHERENPSPSPTTFNPDVNGGATPPLTPKPTTPRSDPNPHPTTFVQADTASFKQVVQMLTGSGDPPKQSPPPPRQHSQIPPKRQGFKLYERRNSLKNNLNINTLVPNFAGAGGFSPRNMPEILSPSLLDFPSLTLSPVTPLPPSDAVFAASGTAGKNENLSSCSSSSEEERAIAEKGFFLSSTGTPRATEPPQLLPLFPVTSPRVSGAATSS